MFGRGDIFYFTQYFQNSVISTCNIDFKILKKVDFRFFTFGGYFMVTAHPNLDKIHFKC